MVTVALFWLQRLAPDHVVSGFFTVWLASIATAFVLEQHLFNSGRGTHTHLAIIEATLMGGLLLHVAKLLPSLLRFSSFHLPTREPSRDSSRE